MAPIPFRHQNNSQKEQKGYVWMPRVVNCLRCRSRAAPNNRLHEE